MIMVNSSWPNTDRKLLDIIPKSLFRSDSVQKMYLKSILDPVMLKYFYYWMREKEYFMNAY